jgi:hypothetical protein
VLHFDRGQSAEDVSALLNESPHSDGETALTASVGSTSDPSEDHATVDRLAALRGSGATLGLIVSAAGVVAAVAGHGVFGLSAAALALAFSLAKDRSVLSCVPAAGVLLMAGVVVLVQFPLITKWPNFGITGVARVAIAGLCLAAGMVVWRRRRALSTLKVTDLPEIVGLSPALFLGVAGVWMATRPVTVATNWFFYWGDNVMRARDVSAMGALGRLDYSVVRGAPGGWWSVVSLAAVSKTDSRGTPVGLLAIVSTNAQLVWALYVLVCAATSLTAMAMVRHFGGHRWASALAGLGAGAVMCWPQFFFFTMGAGFQSTVLLTLLLAVAACEVLTAKAGELRAVTICSAAVVLTAHDYLPGLAIVGVLWLGALARYRAGRGMRVDRRDRSVIVVMVCSALATAPILQMFGGTSGVAASRASLDGMTMRLPVEWVIPGILAAILCLARPGRSRTAAWVGMAVLVAFLEPIGAWLFLHVPIESYYPTKMLWHVAALGVPLVWAWLSLGRLGLIQRAESAHAKPDVGAWTRVILAASVVAGLVGVVPAALGFWTHDGGRILISATSIDAPRAQVAWRAGQNEDHDWAIQRLVSIYSVARGMRPDLSIPLGLSEQCETLRSAAVPIVLTSASQAEVTKRFSCAPGVISVPVQNSMAR